MSPARGATKYDRVTSGYSGNITHTESSSSCRVKQPRETFNDLNLTTNGTPNAPCLFLVLSLLSKNDNINGCPLHPPYHIFQPVRPRFEQFTTFPPRSQNSKPPRRMGTPPPPQYPHESPHDTPLRQKTTQSHLPEERRRAFSPWSPRSARGWRATR